MSVALAHSGGSGFWLTRDYGLAEVSAGLESHTVYGVWTWEGCWASQAQPNLPCYNGYQYLVFRGKITDPEYGPH